jgi:hypothetical protein
MAINTTAQGNISLTAIDLEINGGPLQQANQSLRALSAAAGKSTPDAMSEFSGYSHTITSAVVINGTNAYWGKGARQRVGYTSGNDSYIGDAQGSIASGSPLSSSDGWGLSLSVQVAAWIERPQTNSNHWAFEATTSSSTGVDTTWWNKVTISRSGYSNVVLYRSSATINTHSNYRMNISWPQQTVNYITNGTATWTFSNT